MLKDHKFGYKLAFCAKVEQQYVSTIKIVNADFLSRSDNEDTEWELENSAFNKIVSTFGRPEIDLFARNLNAKCQNFVSRKPQRTALEIDALWAGQASNSMHSHHSC